MYGLVKVVGDDSLRQAKYILIESKKGSVDIRANLLKLGLEINEGRKAEIFYIDGNTKERVYVSRLSTPRVRRQPAVHKTALYLSSRRLRNKQLVETQSFL